MLAFLGAGAIGEALIRGLLEAKTFAAGQITVFDVDQNRVAKLAEQTGVLAAESAVEATQNAEIVLLAVKPQFVEAALEPLRDSLSAQTTLISIAAGVSTSRLEKCFAAPIPVVRAMPNTPALIGRAATALCLGQNADESNRAQARVIFEAVGIAVDADEKLLDAVTGLSGSGPAYVFLFIEALADGGVKMGLARDVALKLAAQTVAGAAQMVLETGEHPGVLKDRVASPGGTTIAGLHALEAGAFRGIVMDAVESATIRARELG